MHLVACKDLFVEHAYGDELLVWQFWGKKAPSKVVRETVIPEPDYRLPFVFLGMYSAFILCRVMLKCTIMRPHKLEISYDFVCACTVVQLCLVGRKFDDLINHTDTTCIWQICDVKSKPPCIDFPSDMHKTDNCGQMSRDCWSFSIRRFPASCSPYWPYRLASSFPGFDFYPIHTWLTWRVELIAWTELIHVDSWVGRTSQRYHFSYTELVANTPSCYWHALVVQWML